jgi:phosphonate transport system substrate-binding protein
MPAGPALTIATYMAPCAYPAYQAAARQIGVYTDRPVRFVEGSSPDELLTGDVDAAFICGLPYVRLADQHPRMVAAVAAPVLGGRRYAGRPVYFSDVIVRRDDPATSLDDLIGRPFAYNEAASYSGWLVVWHHMQPRGGLSAISLSPTFRTGSHQASIASVAHGEADWAAIDSQVLAILVRQYPRLAVRLRVVESLGPSPVPPFVVRTAVPQLVRRQIVEALRNAATVGSARRVLTAAGITGFVAASDADYDPIRAVAGSSRYVGLASTA